MLTTEQLNAIKERAEKATDGPWEVRKWSVPTNDQFFVRQSGESETKEIATAWQGVRYPRMPEICGEEAKANAIFIAHAREDIPALLQSIDELKKALLDTTDESDTFRENLKTIEKLTECETTRDFATRALKGEATIRIGGESR